MSRLRPFRARVGVAGAASLAALSLLVTSLTPLAMRASAADESTQSPDVATSQEAATASSDTEVAAEPAAEAGVEAPAAEDGAEAPAAEVAPEDQPRTRRARAVADDSATLALNVVNDAETLRSHDEQITTINFSCSSVTTPCKGAVIELALPGPITPDGLKLAERGYNIVPVTGDSVARTAQYVDKPEDGSRVQRYRFTLKDPLPAGTSDRIQVTWNYSYYDAPNNSTTTQKVTFSAQNAEKLENELTTTWTADTDIAIEKSGPTNKANYPAVGGEATYKLRYGYQQIDQDNPNKVGIRWNGSSLKNGLNGLGFVGVQNIKVVDPLPAKAVFVTASDGGVYDPATHTVTWSYDRWFWQNPIESTVTVKYPEGTVTLDDTVTNKATISAEVMNDPTKTLTKSSEITHGFAERKVGGRIAKSGNDYQYQVRNVKTPWRFSANNTGNTTLHMHWDDTLPCTWSSQDAKAAGAACDTPTFVGPYQFNILGKSGYEENGGWTFEYWTNKGNHETVNYTKTTGLTLPEGEWITRFTIDTDVAPQTNATIFFYGTVNPALPTTEPADFASHYNPVYPPEKYYNYVASPDYVRFQNCASGTLTDKDTGTVVASNDEVCSWMRVRDEFPSVQAYKSVRTNPVVVGKPATFFINGTAKPATEGGTPTPFTIVDLLPEGFDVDDASGIVPEKRSTLKNPDGTPYDLSKVTVEVEKNYNNTGRTLIRWNVPDPVEGSLYSTFNVNVLATAPAGKNTNDAMAFMPGDGAKATTEDKSLRNTNYCISNRAIDTFDVNKNGSTTDYVCNAAIDFNVATTPSMAIAKEVKGNKNPDFVPAGEVAEIDPGADGAYRFTISNAGNTPLTKVVAYDILPYVGDVGVGPASSQARDSRWKPNLNSTAWAFESVKEKPGRDPEVTAVPASDITVQYSTVPNPCRGEVLSAGGAMNDAPAGCTPNAWGDAPADLTTITGFRLVMNRDIEPGEKIRFIATMTSPVNANLIAWNSVAMSGGSMQNGKVSYLLPNEAPKVGINVSSDVELKKTVARAKMNGDEPVRDANGVIETVESDDVIMPGDYMLYKVNLKAKGPAVASGMNVADALPSGVEYVSSETRVCQDGATNPCTGPVYATANYDAAAGTWTAMESGILDTNLNVGGTETLYVLVKVKPATEGTTITNTATLGKFDQIDSNPDNNKDSATFKVGGTLSGTIYNDADAWWSFNEDKEKPFEGVTVRLLDADGNPVKDSSGADITTKTGADGKYTFTRLPLGSYKVEVVPGEAKLDGTDVNLADYKQTYGYGSSTTRSQIGQGKLVTPDPITLTSAAPNVTKIDFGFVKPVSLGNFVWFDANKNGIQDADEVGVAGVTVTLDGQLDMDLVVDADGNPVKPVTTDANGKYVFTNMLPSSYGVTFTIPDGYSETVSKAGDDRAVDSDGWQTWTILKQGQDDMTIDLGLIADGTIGDTLFWDVDNNGGSEPSGADKPLAGVTVKLTYTTPAGVEKTLTTVTDENGKYSFKDLAPGDYVVTVDKASLATVCPECTAQTHAPSGDLTAAEGQELSLTSKVTLSPGKMTNNDQDWAFTGVANTAIVKAIAEPAEVPAGGFTPGTSVTYTLTVTNEGPSPATGVIAQDKLPSGVTFVSAEGDGTYDAASGKWDLSTEVIEKGATRTLRITVTIDASAAGSVVTNTATIEKQDQIGDKKPDNTSSVPLTAGYTIAGKLYNDADASFSSSDSEAPYAGVTVALLKKDGTPVLDKDGNPMTAVTDAEGKYSFVGLPLGEYTVSVVDPTSGPLAGTKPTEAYTGRYKTTADVTIAEATGSVIDVNFGFVKPASVGDYTWMDVNRDGLQDADEPALPGVTVTLTRADGSAVTDASGNPVAAVTTDANGKYVFENLLPGDYKVSFQAPAGYEATTSEAGDDRAADSNGASASVTLVQGQTDDTIDFGAVGTGVIGDQLFVDVNQNGGNAPDAGDKPLEGVKVTLTWTGPGGITRTYETTTDAEGKYKFENLLPGEYKVSVDPETLLKAEPLLDVLTHSPAGDVDAKKVVSEDAKADKDKLAQAFNLNTSVTLTGEKNQNLDQDWGFGISADTAIMKAITDPDEQAQESFEFTPGQRVTYTLTLTNNGPGAATGVKASDELPSGVSFVSAQGDGSYDSATGVWDLSGLTLAKGDVKTITITVEITGEGAGKLVTNVARITHQDQAGDDPTNNESSASFKGGFNLGGTIYRDSDASYSKSDSEQRFKGVTVALLNEDGTPVLDSEGNPMTAVTDEKGAYQFVGLAPASYRVVIVDPDKGDLAGLIPTQAYTGRGATEAAVTITNASVQGVDFGLVAPATVGDRVWNDADGNGADNGEPGVPGVTVILKDANGVEVGRTTTDANGNYRFTGLVPGTYTVDIEVPAGFNAATTSMTVTVGEGEENLDVDFPLTVIPAPTPATTVAKVLARTGSDASVLGGMAAMAAIAGFAALAGKRRRDREEA
ncbi:SdrD B-like domain-containing protein [Xylanimonas cellulosilytica]|uniref:SdrD B-like domain-containing protein n=1 Tax=Xylanimonas cellulosilytica TaxID=186189 RepID=UPI00065FEF97|nr:SdrD B-like domain-containing protein [Xylanimonas cellulosilytica]